MPTSPRPLRTSAARSPAARITAALLTAALLTAIALSCSDNPPTEPASSSLSAARSALGSSVTVTAANPPYGDQGTVNLDVQITGTGFDGSAKAQWRLTGDTVPSPQIKVNRTTFVSSTQLVANIDIAAHATIASYDIAVVLSGGKKGIGNELFLVTTAQPIGSLAGAVTLGRGLNDAGLVGGYSGLQAYVWEAGVFHDLGEGGTFAIDNAGTTAVGMLGAAPDSNHPAIWTRAPGGAWPAAGTLLPGGQDLGIAQRLASDPVTGQAILIGGFVRRLVARHTYVATPVRWARVGGAWTLQVMPLPSGYSGGTVRDINPNGEAAGSAGGVGERGIVWESDLTTTSILDPLPGDANSRANAIDPTGTLAVGASFNQNGSLVHSVFWTRGAGGTWNAAPIDIEAASGLAGCKNEGGVRDVNAADIAVGQGCDGAVTAWQVSGATVVKRLRLGGLSPQDNGDVEALNDARTPVATGQGTLNGKSVAVVWNVVLP